MRLFERGTSLRFALPLCLLGLTAGCEVFGPDSPDASIRVLESFEKIERLSQADIAAFDLPVDIDFEVDLYRLSYQTPAPDGSPTQASGLVAIPVGTGAAPLVSYQHGTEVRKAGVASVSGTDAGETLLAVAYAATGYVAAMPDYLGLGTSPGLHPFVHSASLATSTVDMLRATRNLVADLGIPLTGQVFLVGYSEGGNATAAAQRLIEAEYASEFDLIASAPMAGAYDLSGTMVDLMKNDQAYPSPYYLPFQLLAYNEIYSLFGDPSEIFVAPLNTLLPGLYDGSIGSGEIDRQIPTTPIDMIRADYLAAFDASDQHPLRVALRDNDLFNWSPQTPTRLYHCLEDDLIPFGNSQVTYDAFLANGAPDVTLVALEFGGHGDCAAPAMLLSKLWFDSLR
ncbi:MAG: hypothetical protein ACI80V_001661 [Rhodothermales bacterium]|jgi:hypothetical protein